MSSGETSPGIPIVVQQHSHGHHHSREGIEIVRKGRNGESNTYSIRFKSTHDHTMLDNVEICRILKVGLGCRVVSENEAPILLVNLV